jgi:hypothetical protein
MSMNYQIENLTAEVASLRSENTRLQAEVVQHSAKLTPASPRLEQRLDAWVARNFSWPDSWREAGQRLIYGLAALKIVDIAFTLYDWIRS